MSRTKGHLKQGADTVFTVAFTHAELAALSDAHRRIEAPKSLALEVAIQKIQEVLFESLETERV